MQNKTLEFLNKNVFKIVTGVLVIILLFMYKCEDSVIEKIFLYENQDTIKYYKDKEGKLHARISILEASKVSNFLELKSRDSVIILLQGLVKKYKAQIKDGGSITIVGTEIVFRDTGSVKVILDSTGKNPTYKRSYSDKWITYNMEMNKDKGILDLKNTNQYSIIIGSEREVKWKFWQSKKSFVDVTNDNPYDKVKTLRTFQVKQKKERFSIGIQVGYGLTFKGLSPYIGIGGQFKLISL